jgi:hypothetical protein
MSNSIDLNTWEEFLERSVKEQKKYSVYRGVKDVEMELETTLERVGRTDEPFEEYHRTIETVKKALESYTEKQWTLRELRGADFLALGEKLGKTSEIILPNYEFLIYLRHHGFPSPFLDWSQSRYVAAFFAFIDADSKKAERCAIYEYNHFGGEGGSRPFCGSKESPRICSLGHTIRAHKRHYLQQAEYTFCVKAKDNAGLIFAPHSEGQGCYVKRYTLPALEKKKVLKSLQEMNITAYTLFGTEDSLIKTLTVDEYLIHDQRIPSALMRSVLQPQEAADDS